MDHSAIYFFILGLFLSDGQSCANVVDVQQQGNNRLNANSLVIIPRSSFSCSYGRLTGFLVSLNQGNTGHNYPHIQMWRPDFISEQNRPAYIRISDYVLTENDIIRMENYYFANVSFAINETTQLQLGDFIGYYQPSSPRYTVWSINTTSYVSFNITTEEYQDTIITKSILNYVNDSQPLIQVLYDIRCNILSTPANGEIMSCSSGRIGVGYEGDSCSFTCNTGYELTGNDTRTCQSDGSWSGSDGLCIRVPCLSLFDLNNGTINCSLRDDGVPSFEDTCSFTCDTGYELTGSDTRTCQSDGSWSGSDDVCRRVSCILPIAPDNGTMNCTLEDAKDPSYEDTCSFTCNTGYKILTGSTERTCESDGSWSGSPVSCIIMECPSSSLPMKSMLAKSCSSTYQSMCELQCQEGFTGTGDPSYVCDVSGNGSSVMWMMVGRDTWRCKRAQCPAFMNGTLQCPNGTTTGVFEDTCTFSCNVGYELKGSNYGTCLANQSWSGGDPICVALDCSASLPLNNSQLQSSCDTQYQSTCTTVCVDGYTGIGGSYTCVVTDEDTNSVGWNGSTSCQKGQCPALMNGILQCPNGATIGVFEDTCTFSCNAGYELQGSNNGTCFANQSWSGGDPICIALDCSASPPLNNSQLQSSCDTQYQSTCTTVCVDGYTGVGGSYTCVVTDEDTNSVGWNGSTSCQKIHCPAVINGALQCPNGATTGVFEDTCSFSCNEGYELQGSNNRTCLANKSWSGGDPICVALTCSDVTMVADNIMISSTCDMTYQSQCTVSCDEGYTGDIDDVTYLCDITSDPTMVDWVPIGGVDVMCKRDDHEVSVSNKNSYSSKSDSIIIGGAMGGVMLLLLMIIVVMCMVILRMKRCNRKQTFPADSRVYCNAIATQLNANVVIEKNSSSRDSDVAIIANPSYAVIANGKIIKNESEYGVVNQPRCNDSDFELTHDITIHACAYTTSTK